MLLCLLTDFYYNILIQHNGMDHIKLTTILSIVHFIFLSKLYFSLMMAPIQGAEICS